MWNCPITFQESCNYYSLHLRPQTTVRPFTNGYNSLTSYNLNTLAFGGIIWVQAALTDHRGLLQPELSTCSPLPATHLGEVMRETLHSAQEATLFSQCSQVTQGRKRVPGRKYGSGASPEK